MTRTVRSGKRRDDSAGTAERIASELAGSDCLAVASRLSNRSWHQRVVKDQIAARKELVCLGALDALSVYAQTLVKA